MTATSFKAFRRGRKSSLRVESYAVENDVPYFWASQPHKKRPTFMISGALLGAGVVVAMYFSHEGLPTMGLVFAACVGLLVPVMAIWDWFETEYLFGVNQIIVKPGAFTRDPIFLDVGNIADITLQQSFVDRRLGLVTMTLHEGTFDEEGNVVLNGKTTVIRGLPESEAHAIQQAYIDMPAELDPKAWSLKQRSAIAQMLAPA